MADWNTRFFQLAKTVASWSYDPSTRVGAVAVNKDRVILSLGWNGFPRGFSDDERLHDRQKKYPLVVHAEENCIFNAARNGASLKGSTMYVWGAPVCADCAKGIVQVGVEEIMMAYPDKEWSWTPASDEFFYEGRVRARRWVEISMGGLGDQAFELRPLDLKPRWL